MSIEKLRNFELFRDLTDNELKDISEIAAKKEYEAGKNIFNERASANKFYIVSKGRVVINMKADGGLGHLPIDTIESGDVFGWSAIIEPYAYTAYARTVEDSELIVIDALALRNLFKKNSSLGFKFMSEISFVIASRLKQLNERFISSLYGQERYSFD